MYNYIYLNHVFCKLIINISNRKYTSMVLHACNSSTQEAEAGRSSSRSAKAICETLTQKVKETVRETEERETTKRMALTCRKISVRLQTRQHF
jgi:hypothetical protein